MNENANLQGQVDCTVEYKCSNGNTVRVVQELKLTKHTSIVDVGTALQRNVYAALLICTKEAHLDESNKDKSSSQQIPKPGSSPVSAECSSPERVLDVVGPDGA